MNQQLIEAAQKGDLELVQELLDQMITEEEITKIILRGKIGLINEKLMWYGRWAETEEQFNSDDTLKFQYEFVGSEFVGSESIGDGSVPLSGKYNGILIVKDPNTNQKLRIVESDVFFTFTKSSNETIYKLSASGSNINGKFTIIGSFDQHSKNCNATKEYDESDNDESDNDD